jgi:hypothetical protein
MSDTLFAVSYVRTMLRRRPMLPLLEVSWKWRIQKRCEPGDVPVMQWPWPKIKQIRPFASRFSILNNYFSRKLHWNVLHLTDCAREFRADMVHGPDATNEDANLLSRSTQNHFVRCHPHPQIWQDIIMCDLAPSLEAILNSSALNFAEFWQNFCKKNCQSFAFWYYSYLKCFDFTWIQL